MYNRPKLFLIHIFLFLLLASTVLSDPENAAIQAREPQPDGGSEATTSSTDMSITAPFVEKAGNSPTVTTITGPGGVFISTLTSTKPVAPTGCFTLTMNGAPLPTLFSGYCSQGVAIVQGAGVGLEVVSLRWSFMICATAVFAISLVIW